MATICRPTPASNSAWDCMAHTADVLLQTATAHLNGRFTFKFANISPRAVKMHLKEEAEGAGPSDYFLTVPVGAEGVEVALGSCRVCVTAGFFDAKRGAYEIFWEGRPFAYEPGITITAAARHSVETNRWCTDVYPGAPAAAGDAGAVIQLLPSRLLSQAGVQMFSLGRGGRGGRGGWVGGGAARLLADGRVELAALCDGAADKAEVPKVEVDPMLHASLVRFPAICDGFASTLDSLATVRVLETA